MTTAVDDLKERMLALSAPDADGVLRAGAGKRTARTALAMDALARLWDEARAAVPFDVPSRGIGLAAVGSLARGQLGPCSDLDLVLIHDGRALTGARLNEFANRLWYPLWDAGLDLDHSVRTRAQCESVTDADLPAAMGWLDVRPVAGDAALVGDTAVSILERWRKAARKRLPELLDSARTRLERFGRMPYVNQPDIKESRGGLRDVVLTAALSASWLADRPHGRYDAAVERLLDVRDCIHLAARRDTNLLLAPYQAPVAAMLGLADPTLPEDERAATSIDDLLTLLARLGRAIAFSLDATAARAEHTLVHEQPRFSFFQIMHPRAGGKREAPKFELLAPGVAVHEQEVVLAPGVNASKDGGLPLRVAAAAAERGLSINTSTLANLAKSPIRYTDWDDGARAAFIRLLASGDRLLDVWEELDFVGIPNRWMPEWAAIRNRPSASAAHRYTIDRHMIAVTSQLVRGSYDDEHYAALLLAGLLHDIGKRPRVTDHAREGERHARAVLERMGFDARIVHMSTLLVREHLILSEFATSRNPNDPKVGEELAARVEDDSTLLDMLFDLTKADMSSLGATSGEQISGQVGWSRWSAQLVTAMAANARAAINGRG
ncbi:protein-PII uridylyltransferase [Bifidobacterium italicum]|uniref:Protein-PII uridylyltransferase n=1 Tax=Bifidobacterium italicum TaxID=1960968 RepID=A0A2A2ELM5_9BIFI|nr:HD domain-containing protein [Bifidobacterium italicum]PAU69971.1 protein-PII uridylyltransferase [Bifidobacterium italicum]